MNDTYIISKINEFMYNLSQQMSEWLEDKLPRITDNWWNELVINNLSMLQREQVISNNINDVKGLDLASLLRIFDRNWFVITSKFFINNRERDNVKKMLEIRNTWAHITPNDINKNRIISDIETIISLMQTFGASMKDTRDMEAFIFDVEEDRDIQKEEEKTEPQKNDITEITADSTIKIGSLVVLVSDPSIMGAVTGITGNKYSVLINGRLQSFYEEQIKLYVANEQKDQLSLRQVKSAITAYQINNPNSNSLYSLNSARIDFVPYQFRPALKLIKSDSPRLLVADDVGVGKTIEAGLILKELEARSSINSVLIICPRPLVAERKWELEMKRFDENFTQLDGREFLEAISETDRDGEWPERHRKTIIPYSLFGEDSIMGTQSGSNKKRKVLGLGELDPIPHFDLVIVDEAHNIRNSNTWMYRGVEIFCRNADAVVFLTATPLQNSNNDLYTLLNLLRPDIVIDRETFRTMSEPNAYINNLLRIVRNQEEGWNEQGKECIDSILSTDWGRNVIQHNPHFEVIYDFLSKEHVTRDEKIDMISKIEGLHSFNGLINRTRRRDIENFCIRRTQTVKVPYDLVQRTLYDMLIEFETTSLTILHGSRSARFMMCTIMRQAASCIYGLAPFMKDILSRRLEQIQEDGELYEYDYSIGEAEGKGLSALADRIAELSADLPEYDPKFEKMYEIIARKQREDNNRVIIFSSFRHTLSYLKEKLQNRGIRVGYVDGDVPDEERFNLRKCFLMGRNDTDAIDIMLFSEVGCEGLDYQFCDTMINYDLPWNPMRIEQRIGRIDRRGQESDTVKIYNMITADTIDAVIYDRCLSKIGVFEASIGDCAEILGGINDQILKIMFDSELTEEERQIKIEKMADNEVMKVQELHRLEHEEKSLFGFDLSDYILNKDVQEAENSWISPASIQELINVFLNDFLGDGEYIIGKSEQKSLRLSNEKRQMLLENLKKTEIVNNNNATKLWNAYLKSDKPILPVTFDSVCAKDNRDITFLTQMHPLVIQAATYESSKFPCELGISVSTDDIPPGNYEFLIYAWKYVGLRPDIKMIVVSENDLIRQNVLGYIQYGSEYEYTPQNHIDKWEEMDSLHYTTWQNAKEKYSHEVKDECNYRMEQLGQSFNQRDAIFRNMIINAADDKIRRMRKSQLDKLKSDFNAQKKAMDETIKKADIHTNLIIKGVLHVERENV